jgi:hypothetical protein
MRLALVVSSLLLVGSIFLAKYQSKYSKNWFK